MWKTLTLLTLTLLSVVFALAQKNKEEELLFVFDQDWKPCDVKKAYYLVSENKLNDSVYEVRYYTYSGPLIGIETYKDDQKTIPNGFFAFYDKTGKVDSCGYSYMGKKDKDWLYFDDSIHVYHSRKYDKGKLIEEKDQATLKAERAKQKQEQNAPAKDGEKEASFKKGEKDWRSYIEKNLEIPNRALNNGIGGKVRIRFMIDTEGRTTDIWLDQSVEYTIDKAAIQLIRNSPVWNPALKDGKPVNAWRIQPVTFGTM